MMQILSFKPYFLHWYLLLYSFGVVFSGKEIVAYRGMSVKLFPNVSVDTDVSLYVVNGEKDPKIIARLQTGNGIDRDHWWIDREYSSKIYIDKNEYSSKIDIDKVKNITFWLCNLDQGDAGTYYLVHGVNMRGPDTRLTILDPTEENHPKVCWSSRPNFTEKYGKLTEVQIREEIKKCLDDRLEYVKTYIGNLTEEQIGEEIQKWLDNHPEYFKKYFGRVMPEQILQMLCNHPQEVLKGPSGSLTEEQITEEIPKWLDNHPEYFRKYFDSWNSPIQGLLIATCILEMITLLCILLINRNHIREGCINVKHWIQKRLCSQHRSENLSQTQEFVIEMKEQDDQIREQIQKCLGVYPVLMEKCLEKFTDDQINEQMQKCLGVYPVLMEKYFEKLTEDQIWVQMQKWQDVYPGHFMKKYLETLKEDQVHKGLNDHPEFLEKYLDQNGINPTYPPTLEELAVTPIEVENEIEYDQSPLGLLHGKLINPSNSSSDQPENYHQVFKTADSELSLTAMDAGTERNYNQTKWISSEDKLVTSQTGISPNSDSKSELSHSGFKPFSMEEQGANLEWDMAQTKSEVFFVVPAIEDSNFVDECDVPLLCDLSIQMMERLEKSVKEDSNFEDECKELLLKVHDDQKPQEDPQHEDSIQEKRDADE